MGREIDERVVEMRFDNKQFEAETKRTMGTLDRLKKSLNFNDADKSLNKVQNNLNSMQFNALENSLNSINKRFSFLGMTAITTASRIADSFISSGQRIVKEFTIDPIKTGFQEYETQMGAIQTILSNTSHAGTTLDEVNAALNELNHYADKTIYNFTQMTKNIGTFTAAGISLDDSTNAIKGIANLAAVSGSTAQQASTAMYQLSQALAAGRVSLMDWNSVVNAGMGGKVFQDALLRTSDLLKTGGRQAIKTYGSFRESLTAGKWLTVDVLTETLKQLSGAYTESDLLAQGYNDKQAKDIIKLANTAEAAATDVKTFTQMMDTLKETAQSGWTQTWELIAGDFEEGKALWTNINNVVSEIINKQSESRNELLGDALTTGWDKLANQGVRNLDLYKDTIKTVVRENGINIDYMIEKYGSLDQALKAGLSSGELSYDMMGTALHKYTEEVESMSAEELKASGYTADQVKALQSLNSEIMKGQTLWEKLSWKGIKDTERYKKVIKAVAVDSGVNMDYLIGKYGNMTTAISEGLKSGEINHEILTKAVTIYGNELSTMSEKEFEAAGYTKEELKAVKELEKGLKDGTISMEKYVNEMGEIKGKFSMKDFFKDVGDKGGRELLLKSFSNIYKGLKTVIDPIKEAFRDIFPPLSATNVYETIKAFEDLTSKFKLSASTSDKLHRTFKGLFSIIKLIGKPFKSLAKLIFPTAKAVGSLGDSFLDVTANIGDFFTKLNETDDATKGIETTFDNLFAKAKDIGNKLKEIFLDIKDSVHLGDLSSLFNKDNFDFSFLNKGGETLDKFKESFDKFKEYFDGGHLTIYQLIKSIGILGSLTLVAKKVSKLNELTAPFKEVGESAKKVAKEAVNIGKLFKTGMSGVVNTLNAFQKNIKADTMLKIAGAIALLAVALGILAFVPPDRLISAAIGLGAIVGALSFMLNALSKMDLGSAAKPGKIFSEIIGTFKQVAKAQALLSIVLGLAVLVVAIAGSLALLATLPWQGVVAGAASLSLVIFVLIEALKELNNSKSVSVSNLVTFGVMVVALIPIMIALKELAAYPFESLIGAGLAMSGVLAAIIGCMLLISKVSDMKGFVPALAFLALGVSSMFAVAKILGDLANTASPEALIATAISLATIFGTLTIAMGACALIGAVAPAAVAGIALLDLFLANLIAVFYVVGDKVAGMAPKVLTGIEFLKIIGAGLGGFLGSIVNGFVTEASKALGPLGEGLSNFWIKASVFFMGVNMLGSDFGDKVKSVAGAIVVMTAAELLQGILNFVGAGDSLSSLGTQLSTFMVNATPFFLALSVFDSSVIKSAEEVAKMMLMFTAGEIIRGLTDFLGFGGNLADFGKDLGEFGPSIKEFADTVKGIDEKSVKGAAAATEIMSNAAKNLYGEGGLKQWLGGEKDLASFAKQLEGFGPSLVKFADTVKDIKPESITGATKVTQMIIDLANKIPEQGGLISWFKGDNTMKQFGDGMVQLGKAIYNFASKVCEITSEEYEIVDSAIDLLNRILRLVPPEEGVMGRMGTDVKNLGENLKDFYSDVSDIDFEKCNATIGMLNRYKDLAVALQGIDTTVLTTFGTAISTLAGTFMDAGFNEEQMNNSVLTFLTNIGIAFQNNAETIRTLGTTVSDIFLVAWATNTLGVTFNTIEFIKSINSIMMSYGPPEFTKSGHAMANMFVKAINDYRPRAISAGRWLADSALNGIRAMVGGFRYLGEQAGQGFVDGILSMVGAAQAAAAQLGQASQMGLRRNLSIHSPSKVMYGLGDFAGVAYILALKSYVRKAYEISKSIGDATINGVKKGYSQISRIIDLDELNDPVLRPTVDLSGIRSSTSQIAKMFNDAIGTTKIAVDSISTDMTYNKNRLAKERQKAEEEKGKGDTNITYTQNNYSPKALSRIDIYRNTKNQLSAVKEVVRAR